MTPADLNQLVTLDMLLAEGSVAGAARRLRLSPSAMSRALARLRETMGDPLLVRAGRGLVPTPRAIALRDRVRTMVEDAQAVLRPADNLDLATLNRTFVLRASDGFVENFGPAVMNLVGAEAPGVRLRFLRKLGRDSAGLRDGTIDLETGVVGRGMGPEVRTQPLFRDRFVGVVGPGHPLAAAPVTARLYAASRHVLVSRGGDARGHIDEILDSLGLARDVAATVDGFSAALALVRGGDLVTTVPEAHSAALCEGLHCFALPFDVPELVISLLWHPRQDGDPAHRWLRRCVRAACAERLGRRLI